jgi:NTP pyrophosphatase (non-canonical NTP hydrolase)
MPEIDNTKLSELFDRYVAARGLVFKNPNPSGRKVAEEGIEYAIEIAAGNFEAAELELADVVIAACRQAQLLGTTVEACIEKKIIVDTGRDIDGEKPWYHERLKVK